MLKLSPRWILWKKIPSNLAEKWKFNVPLKIEFLAFWVPCISKTVRDKKKIDWKQFWKLSFREIQWKKSHHNWMKNKNMMWPRKSCFCPFRLSWKQSEIDKIGCNNSESSQWEESNEKKSHQIWMKNKNLMWPQKSHFCPFGPLVFRKR